MPILSFPLSTNACYSNISSRTFRFYRVFKSLHLLSYFLHVFFILFLLLSWMSCFGFSKDFQPLTTTLSLSFDQGWLNIGWSISLHGVGSVGIVICEPVQMLMVIILMGNWQGTSTDVPTMYQHSTNWFQYQIKKNTKRQKFRDDSSKFLTVAFTSWSAHDIFSNGTHHCVFYKFFGTETEVMPTLLSTEKKQEKKRSRQEKWQSPVKAKGEKDERGNERKSFFQN